MARISTRAIQKPSNRQSSTREVKRYTTKGKASGIASQKTHWYDEPVGNCHDNIFQYVRAIKSRQIRRRYQLAVYQQLYRNDLQNIFAASGLFAATAFSSSLQYQRISANVIKSCCDTATARIAKSKPRAFALPKRGDYRLK